MAIGPKVDGQNVFVDVFFLTPFVRFCFFKSATCSSSTPPSLLLSTCSFSLCLLCLSPPILSWASLPLVPPLFLQPLLETSCSVRFKPVVFSEVYYPEGLGFPEHGNSFYSFRSLLHLQLRTTAKQQLYSAFASKCTLLRFKIFGSCDRAVSYTHLRAHET